MEYPDIHSPLSVAPLTDSSQSWLAPMKVIPPEYTHHPQLTWHQWEGRGGRGSFQSPLLLLASLSRVQIWWDSLRPRYACALIPPSVTTPPTRCSFLLTLFNLEVKLHYADSPSELFKKSATFVAIQQIQYKVLYCFAANVHAYCSHSKLWTLNIVKWAWANNALQPWTVIYS